MHVFYDRADKSFQDPTNIILGIPSAIKQASAAFLAYGIHYRKAGSFADFPIRLQAVNNEFVTAGLYSVMLFSIISAFTNLAVPLVSGAAKFVFSKIPLLYTTPITFVIAAREALKDSDVVLHSLSKVVVAGGNYKHGYIRQATPEEAQAIYIDLSTKYPGNIDWSNGVSGRGLPVRGYQAFMLLQRITYSYLLSQPATVVETLGGEEQEGHVRTAIEILGEEADVGKGLFEEDEQWKIGKDSAAALNIEKDEEYNIIRVKAYSERNIFRTLEHVEETDCHLIRYIPGTIPADVKVICDFLTAVFSQAFGTVAEAKQSIDLLATHIPRFGNFTEGQEVLFLVAVMIISFQMRCKVNIIREGSRIMGAQLVTAMGMEVEGAIRVAVPADAVKAAVSQWITRSKALESLAVLLSDVKKIDTDRKAKVNVQDIDTLDKLCRVIESRNRLSPSRELWTLCLSLNQTYDQKPAATQEIVDCLTRIHEETYPADTYVTPELFTGNTIVVSNLSIFGPRSISLLNPGGRKEVVYKHKVDDPNKGTKVKVVVRQIEQTAKKGKRKFVDVEEEVPYWSRILVSRVEIAKAISDFDFLRSEHEINQMTTYDARSLGSLDIHPLPHGDGPLLDAIRLFGQVEGPKQVARVERMSKKAKVAEGDEKEFAGFGW